MSGRRKAPQSGAILFLVAANLATVASDLAISAFELFGVPFADLDAVAAIWTRFSWWSESSCKAWRCCR